MRALFAFDHRFIPVDGAVYSESQFPSSFWSRYLAVFDAVTVLGRKGEVPSGKTKSDMEESDAENVRFVFVPGLSSLAAQVRDRRTVQQKIGEEVRKVDAVIARLPSELGLAAITQARKAGVPWAVEVVGCPWDALWNYGSWQGKAYARIMMARMRRAVAAAPFVLYVTREFLQNRYPNQRGVTVACSNVEVAASGKTKLNNRFDRIDKETGPLILGMIGQMRTRFKGIQTVFEALSRVSDSLPSVEFRLLGSGDPTPWQALAKRYGVENLVYFDGTLPGGSLVLGWLDNVDIYLQPSLHEGLPRALIEAMTRACPAIASSCAGIPELLDEDCMIPPGDARGLGALLIKAAYDLRWQRYHAERNWQHSKTYTHDVLGKQRFEFWREFASFAAMNNRHGVISGSS